MSLADRIRAKLIIHAGRFASLGVITNPLQLPLDDGDIAELRELRDRLAAVLRTAEPAAVAGALAQAARFHADTVDAYVLSGPVWPVDRAARMLADWRAELDQMADAS